MLAAEIVDNGAMTSLHVGLNGIPEKEMKEIMAIAARKESMKILCEVPFKDKTIIKLDVSGKLLGMEGALVVAEYLRDNGALTSLNLSSNKLGADAFIGSTELTKVLAEALKANQVMTELNLSDNAATWDGKKHGEMSGIVALAEVIPDMGALTHLDVSDNNLGKLVSPDGWEAHTNGTHFKQHGGDWTTAVPAGLQLQPLGIITIANAIPDMGAMMSLNLASNKLGVEGAKIIAACLPECT
jgi:hypothetical protein